MMHFPVLLPYLLPPSLLHPSLLPWLYGTYSLPPSLPGPYVYADVLDLRHLHSIVVNHNIDWVVHFSAILSAIGEKDVNKALEVCTVYFVVKEFFRSTCMIMLCFVNSSYFSRKSLNKKFMKKFNQEI